MSLATPVLSILTTHGYQKVKANLLLILFEDEAQI